MCFLPFKSNFKHFFAPFLDPKKRIFSLIEKDPKKLLILKYLPWEGEAGRNKSPALCAVGWRPCRSKPLSRRASRCRPVCKKWPSIPKSGFFWSPCFCRALPSDAEGPSRERARSRWGSPCCRPTWRRRSSGFPSTASGWENRRGPPVIKIVIFATKREEPKLNGKLHLKGTPAHVEMAKFGGNPCQRKPQGDICSVYLGRL